MKKILLIISLAISVNMMFAQTATLKIGTLLDQPAGTVLVPVTLEAINNPIIGSNLISSWGWYIAYDASVLNAGAPMTPATLVNYLPGFAQANYLTNIIADNPVPGWNTIAVIYSAAVSGTANPGDKFFDIQFTYVGLPAETDIIWTSTSAKDDLSTKFETNMADDEGNEFVLTLIDGHVGTILIPCLAPSNLYAINVTAISADLGWTENGTATMWDIELGEANFIPTGVPTISVNVNPYTYFGLNKITHYDFYVRANCGIGYSIWVGPFSFITDNQVIVWDGSESNDFGDPLNWTPPGVPGTGDDVIIPPGTPFSPVMLSDVTINSLEVQAGAIFTNSIGFLLTVINETRIYGLFRQWGRDIFCILYIYPGGTLIIGPYGNVTTNCLFTNDGTFLIQSDATGSAGSFIDNAGIGGNGTYEFDRFLVTGPPGTPFGWHYVSSPVNNSVSGDFVAYWLKEWTPVVSSYFDIDPWGDFNGIPCDLEDYSLGSIGLNVMQGYSVKEDLNYEDEITPWCPQGPIHHPSFPGPYDNLVKFGGNEYGAGVPNLLGGWIWAPGATTQTAHMVNVNTGFFNTNVDWLGAGPFSQWNLLGNPYSAPISCGAFTAGFPFQVNGSIHYWDNAALNYAVWAAGVGQPFIPATQGFMVEVNAPGFIGPVTVNNGMRTHIGAGMFYKSEVNDLLVLQATGNGLADKTYIRFLDDANVGFDREFDAHKLFSEANGIPQIYTTIGEEMLAINALPSTTMVPMDFTAGTAGTYTIEAIETSEFQNVVLEDMLTGEQTDLLTVSYTFNYTEGVHPFIVHFTPLGSPELEANSIRIWSGDKNIYVAAPSTTGDIVVYNLMGQEVVRTDIEAGLNVIPMKDANTYYIVKVIGSEVTGTGKVFIK